MQANVQHAQQIYRPRAEEGTIFHGTLSTSLPVMWHKQ